MAYKALYRSYRPTNFDEVVGQKHIIKTLKNAITENRVSHAYIFSGLRGIGKTTIARIFAKAVNCELSKDGEPCNVCRNCLSIINEETSDVVELDAASNNGVEEMRDILEKVNFLPGLLNKKVYIIDEAHMLSTSAFNALLKTLEEPPAHVIFILATTEPYKIPPTILSRCQRLDFKQLTNYELLEMLTRVVEKENIKISDEALNAITEAAEGGMRDALGILDQARVYSFEEITLEDIDSVTGRVSNYHLIDFMTALNNQDTAKALETINQLLDLGKEVSRVVNCVIQFCRDMLLYKSLGGESDNQYIFNNLQFQRLADEISENKLFYYVDMFVDVQNKIRFTNSQKIYLEVGIIKIINSATQDLNLLEQIQKLEERISNIQPSEGGEYSNDSSSRFDTIDNKINKILNDIDKLNINEFKERVESKLNLLEEVTSAKTTSSEEFEKRVKEIIEENPVVSNVSFNNDTVENKVSPEFETKLKELENRFETINTESLTTKVEELEKRVTSISQPIVQTQASDIDESIIKSLEDRLDAIEANKPSSQNNDSMPNDGEYEDRMTTVEEYLDMVIARVDELARGIKNNYPSNVQNESIIATSETDQIRENFIALATKVQELQAAINQKDEETGENVPNKELAILQNQFNEFVVNTEDKHQSQSDSISSLQNQVSELAANVESKIEGFENKFKDNLGDSVDTAIEEVKKYIDNVKDYSFKLNARVNLIEEKLNDTSSKVEGNLIKRRSPIEIPKVEQEEPIKETKVEQPKVEKELGPRVTSNEKTVVIRTPSRPLNQDNSKVDETTKIYDSKVVERILHQARDQQCRADKINLLTGWGKMEDRVGHLLSPIAKLLSEGTLTANGYNELLIVYPRAAMCNCLMEPKGHTNALQVLKINFGKEYDFIALPENTWQEKRMEYTGQYNIGIKFPKLTPINNPELKVMVINSANLSAKKNEPLRKAESLFGEGLVEKEEDE